MTLEKCICFCHTGPEKQSAPTPMEASANDNKRKVDETVAVPSISRAITFKHILYKIKKQLCHNCHGAYRK